MRYINKLKKQAKAFRLLLAALAIVNSLTSCDGSGMRRRSIIQPTVAPESQPLTMQAVQPNRERLKLVVVLHGINSPRDYSVVEIQRYIQQRVGNRDLPSNLKVFLPERRDNLSVRLSIKEQAILTIRQVAAYLDSNMVGLEDCDVVLWGDSQGGLVAAMIGLMMQEYNQAAGYPQLAIKGLITTHTPWGGAPILAALAPFNFLLPEQWALSGVTDMHPLSNLIGELNRSVLQIPMYVIGGSFIGEDFQNHIGNYRMIAAVLGGYRVDQSIAWWQQKLGVRGNRVVTHLENWSAAMLTNCDYNDVLLGADAQFPSYYNEDHTHHFVIGHNHYESRLDEEFRGPVLHFIETCLGL